MFWESKKVADLKRQVSQLRDLTLITTVNLERTLKFLEASPWGILVVDTDYDVVFMNSTLERLSGWNRKELHKKSMHVLIPEDVRDVHSMHEEDFSKAPRTRHGDYPLFPELMHKDGHRVPVEISLGHTELMGEKYYFASIRERGTLPT